MRSEFIDAFQHRIGTLLDGLREKKTYFLVTATLSKHATVIQSIWFVKLDYKGIKCEPLNI